MNYPKDWEEVRLGDLVETSSGGTPNRTIESFYSGSIPWVTTGELQDSLINKTLEHITEEAVEKSSAKLFPKCTILLAMYGATIGKLGLLSIPATTNQACCALLPSKRYNSYFLYFKLRYMRSELISLGAGAGQPNISQKIIKNLVFCIPSSLPEQQAIADALTAFDTHINNLAKLIEKKKMIRDGAVEDLVSGKRRLAGFSGKWESKSLLDIAIILNGLTYKPEDVRPYGKLVIRSSNIKDGKLVYIDNVYVDEAKSTSEDVAIGDVIICVRNGSSALIGKSAYVQENIDATVGAFMSNIRCHNTHLSKFFYYFTKTETFKDFINEVLGATINQITKSDLKRLKFAIPLSLSEQQAIADILTAMDKEISDLEEEKEKYIALKAGAMDDLLTGKIRLV